MNPASLAVEATKVAKGKESGSNFLMYIFVAISVDAYIEYKETDKMFENIFIPAGAEDQIFIITIIGAVLIPFFTSLVFKENSKGKNAAWEGKYIFTLFASMILTPTVSLILDTMIVSKYFADIDAFTYCVVLLITMLAVAYGTQKVLGEGIKALVDQVVSVKKDLDYAQDQLKKN